MKDYEDEAFDDIERAQQRKVATGMTDGSGWRKRQIAEQGEPVAFKCGDAIVHIKPPVYGNTHPPAAPVQPAKQEQGETVAWQERQSRRVNKTTGEITEWSPWYESKGPSTDYINPKDPRIEVTYQWRKLYTTPQQRTWVKPHEWVLGECVKCGVSIEQEYLKPLTDEQKIALCKQFPDSLTFDAIAAIEAAHGIKENT